MTERERLDALCMKMMAHDRGSAGRIQHFLKVSALAALIAREEGADPHLQYLVEAAGYVHDIGIRIAEERCGYQNGKLQEELGPPAARPILEALRFTEEDTERICFLISRHHTYDPIEGPDHQILVEADFLVNLMESHAAAETVRETYRNIFRTKSGRAILREMFDVGSEAEG